MSFETIRIVRDDPRAWAWMPLILARMEDFCRDIDVESTPKEITDLVRALFTSGDWRFGLWVLIQDGVQLVGHLWVVPEPLGGETVRYLLIRQARVDKGIDARAECRAAFEEMLRWGKSLGVDTVMALTHRDEAAMFRAWNFEGYKTLLKRRI